MAGRGRHSSQAAATQLPAVGEPVRVSLPGHHTGLRSQVHGVAGDELVIAAPVESPGASPLPLGGELSLSWANDSGLHHVSVQLRERLNGLQRWRVGLVTPPQREQRRTGDRVPVMSGVGICLDGSWQDGTLVDLSEGGLRCLLGPRAPALERSSCRVRLDVVRSGLELDGVIVRVREGVDAMTDVGVQFAGVPAAAAAELRRYLSAAQQELQRLDDLPER